MGKYETMRSLDVIFYRPTKEDHWINHMVSFMNPPYSHCDLLFDDGVATSIYNHERVYQERKSFSRKEYEWLSLSFTDDEIRRIRRFCDDCHKKRVEFDFWGMLLSYLPYNPRDSDTKTFCSKFVWEALQRSNRVEFTSKNAATMTPSRIFRSIEKMNRSFLNVSPKRLDRL